MAGIMIEVVADSGIEVDEIPGITAAVAGAAARIAKSIKKAEIITYEDLGAEALRRLEVVDFPAIVINDIYGGDLYQEGQKQWNELDK